MRVLLVDDDKIVVESLLLILQNEGIEIVGTASSGNEVKRLYRKKNPDVIVMDINMGDEDGLQISSEIIKSDKDAKILILSAFGEPIYVKKALKIGVQGYLLKENFSSLKVTLEAIVSGQTVYDKKIRDVELLFSEQEPLTKREDMVLDLIAEGYSNKEIAEKLFLSEGTVRNLVSEILAKSNVRDRTGLAIKRLKGQI